MLAADLVEVAEEDTCTLPDVEALKRAADSAETAVARAEGAQESAIDGLRELEELDKPLAAAEAGAARDLQNAGSQLGAIESRTDFAGLELGLDGGRKAAAEASMNLEDAERDASAHDAVDIERRIKAIDARSSATAEAKRKLETEIARPRERWRARAARSRRTGGVCREEAEAARKHFERVRQEAETLKLLRETLEAARAETSRTYVEPVARRARRYIEQLLPAATCPTRRFRPREHCARRRIRRCPTCRAAPRSTCRADAPCFCRMLLDKEARVADTRRPPSLFR